ncbi:srx-2 [Pristionchus pacificus]|uniref:Srx-2 n=1 Tax=Pristionchus pacificus TaxID=54126 RepID=A0A2A6CPB5_PRIPA|nr:srx-2 [Pristionchus pacificus]|eukprot:PDM80042.1 srx-2 [Pristionchus pacificus]
MPANLISYIGGSLFGIIAITGLLMNFTVLLAMFKGKLFSSKSSPVYILSSQTITVDSILLLVHLFYQCPSVMLQSNLFPARLEPAVHTALNATFMYCWYHNTLSHILIAINRLCVIVFYRIPIFTRQRTIVLCVLQHLLALSFSVASQFLLPCCEFSFSWVVFSYQYNEKRGIVNYSNKLIDLPLNSSSSLISIAAYSAIIWKMHYSRMQTKDLERSSAARLMHKEYRYAIQFASMALVYLLTWTFFRAFPVLIGNTKNLYVYGVVTILAEMNMLTNSTVYLVNNAEIKKSIRAMISKPAKVNVVSTFESTMSNVGTTVTASR